MIVYLFDAHLPREAEMFAHGSRDCGSSPLLEEGSTAQGLCSC